MDVQTFVAEHRHEWDRLDQLANRGRRLSGAEIDELVELYRLTSTHLSAIQSTSRDAGLVSRLTSLLARARSAIGAASSSPTQAVSRFVLVGFPLAVYRARRWWISTALVFIGVATALGWWIATHPAVQGALASPEQIQQLVDRDFENYYSSSPAGSFAAQVWTNNAMVAAVSIVFGILLGLPVIYVLFQNAANVAASGGLMAANGKLGLFFGLILPHGLLELTAVFVAAGVGLRLGWTVIDPGPRTRSRAIAEEGRSTFTVAIGLVFVLFVSGIVEAFVTPSGLPTWGRIAIGAIVWGAFIAYVFVLGRRAERLGLSSDVADDAQSAQALLATSA